LLDNPRIGFSQKLSQRETFITDEQGRNPTEGPAVAGAEAGIENFIWTPRGGARTRERASNSLPLPKPRVRDSFKNASVSATTFRRYVLRLQIPRLFPAIILLPESPRRFIDTLPGMRPFSAHTNSQIDSARLVHGAVRRSRISPSAGNVFFANWPDALRLFKWFSLWFSATRMPSLQNGHDV
jgi:hypothetical protein